MGKPADINNFWNKVKKTNSCWEWQGARQIQKGKKWHGLLTFNKQGWLAHRFSWTIHNGPIPTGQYICHTCDNPACVNPDHLFLGSQADNMRDMNSKGRHADQKGIKQSNVKLSEADVYLIRSHPDISSKWWAKNLDVHPTTINDIKKRRTWNHI